MGGQDSYPHPEILGRVRICLPLWQPVTPVMPWRLGVSIPYLRFMFYYSFPLSESF